MAITILDNGAERVHIGSATDKVIATRADSSNANTSEVLGTGQAFFGGGILPFGGSVFTATRASFPVGAFASSLSGGTDTTPTAGSVYFGALFLPCNYTLTGVGYSIGSVGGTDSAIVALYDSTGAVVANSALAGTVVGSANTFQQIAFTGTYAAKAPGLYYVSVSVNGTTCRLRLTVAAGIRGGSAAGSFGTLATITPPTANAAAPIAYVY